MATITIENVPESVVKAHGQRINFSYDLSFVEDFDLDFRELGESEVTPDLLRKLEAVKKIPKSQLHNLSKEYTHS